MNLKTPLNATLSPQRGTRQENKKSQQFISAPSILQGSGDRRGGSPPSAPSAACSPIVHPEVPSHISGPPPLGPHPQWVGHPGTPRVPQGAQVVPCPAAGLGRRETLSQERRHKEPMLRWVAFVGFVFFFLSLVFFFSSIHFFMKTAPRVLRPTGCQKETEQKTKTKDKKNLALLSSRLSEISSCSIEGSGF